MNFINRKVNPTLLLFISAFLLQVPAGAATPAPAKFNAPPRDYAQSYPANTLVTGDFNNDGTTDIVTVSASNTTPRGEVRLGVGNGTFRPGIVFYPGNFGDDTVAGDFNGDGKLDLIVGGLLLLGNGNGTFQTPVSIGVGGAAFINVADLNGDGALDLVLVHNTSHVSIVLGNGDGTFQPPESVILEGPYLTALAIADVNHDSIPDLLSVFGPYNGLPGNLNVALGNGDGTFQSPSITRVGAHPTQIATGDFNGDGKLDVVVADSQPGGSQNLLTTLIGDGTGSFIAGESSAAVSGPTNIVAGDFNGDGKLDIASGVLSGDLVALYLSNGDGSFQAPSTPSIVSGGLIAVADFNGDGALDIVSGNVASEISVLLGKGNGSFAFAPRYSHPAPASNVVLGDATGDGRLDLITVNQSGAIETLPGNGDSTFGSPLFSSSVPNASVLALADFNGDGVPDAAILNSKGAPAVLVQLNNGDGTFQAPLVIRNPRYAVGLAAADINGDGKADLIVGSDPSATIYVLLGNGDGTFQAPLSFSAGFTEPLSIVVADVNGDGRPDLILGDTDQSQIAVMLGNGDGSFQAAIATTLPLYSFTGQIAVGDLNGDGILDVGLGEGSSVGILLGHGDGTFQPLVQYNAGISVTGLSLVDLNLDGDLDIVATTGGNNLLVLPGYGDGTFQTLGEGTVSYGTSKNPLGNVVGDLNGDGKPDVIAITPTDISVFTNRTE